MKIEYGDDIAYVRLRERQAKVAKTIEVAPGLMLDVDEHGEGVGLEVMGLARRGLPLGVVAVEMLTGTSPLRAGEQDAARRLRDALSGD